MKQRKLLSVLLLLLIAAFFIYKTQKNSGKPARPKKEQVKEHTNDPGVPPPDRPARTEGLNRNATALIYSKHARCRMDCRHIDESEVKEMLDKGEINYKKSETGGRNPRYAVEGITHDNQHVRIVFADDDEGTVVVTVIDLEREWECDCE